MKKLRSTSKHIHASFVIGLLAALLSGCGREAELKLAEQKLVNQALLQENTDLKARVAALENENRRLENTPERLLSTISSLVDGQDVEGAKAAISSLTSAFPHADEVPKAERLLADLESRLRADREAEERKNRLGFKAFKEVGRFDLPSLKVVVSSVQIARRWTFDSYGDHYHYRDSPRGSRYVTARVSITAEAENKDPSLPGFGIYEVSGNNLNLATEMRYEFVRWSDYGTYLGNYTDYRNDFAHTETIPFTVGATVSDDKLAAPMFLVAAHSSCHHRSYDRFENPPVSYRGRCEDIKIRLSLDDLSSGKYSIIKIWNAGKL